MQPSTAPAAISAAATGRVGGHANHGSTRGAATHAAAIVHIIPYAGSAVTIVAVGIAAFVQFEDIARALTVAFCVGLAATVIGMGLTAWIQGRAFRMNAVAVFIALHWRKPESRS